LVTILNEMRIKTLRHTLHHEVWIRSRLLLLVRDTIMRLLIILINLGLTLATVAHSCIHLRLVWEWLHLSTILHLHLLVLMHESLVVSLLFIPVYRLLLDNFLTNFGS